MSKEINEYSPARFVEKVCGSRLGAGEIGVVASKPGIGKTAFLVQFALDAILRGENVVHVSIKDSASNVNAWYDSIISEIRKKSPAIDFSQADMLAKRTVISFPRSDIGVAEIAKTVRDLSVGRPVNLVLIDGFDVAKTSCADIESIVKLGDEKGVAFWFSMTVAEIDDSGTMLPKDIEGKVKFATVMRLQKNGIILSVRKPKGGDETARLDPRTFLLA